MKQLVAALVLVVCSFVLYRSYQEHLAQATAEAAAKARADALRSMPTPARPKATPFPLAPVAVSRKLESTYVDLISDIGPERPFDLVPPIQLIKERLVDKQASATGAKRSIYDSAVELSTGMASLAEVRTQLIESVLNNLARDHGPLDNRNMGGSGKFFAQGVKSRWTAEVQHRKPALDQLFATLRARERDWNKTASANLLPEGFDSPDIPAPTITADLDVSSSSLQQGAYDQRRVRPWRSLYYNQTGYSGVPR